MPKVLSSWSMTNDGKLIENDLKLSYSEEDGSYTIESKHDSIGIILGFDGATHKYTIITSIPDTKRMARFKPFVNVGDILVAINDEIVIELPFKEVTKKLESLVKAGTHRKLTFLNRHKYSIDLFIRKLQLNSKAQTDLLGFTCSPEDHLLEKHYQLTNSNYLQLRDLEWVNYLKSIGGIENLKPAGIFKPYKDLKTMVRKGIPVAYRASIWPKISLSSVYRLQFPADYYQTLLVRSEGELAEKVKIDIEKDIDRTFPEHHYFNTSAGSKGEESLRRILYAFAVHNPSIGYCQSLNFVAGMMLIFMSEEESFWLLITVVEKLLPADYYTASMVGTYVDQFVLAHIIKKYLPRINETLESNQLQLPLITVQWFMCLFVNTLKPEVTLRIWDMFLNEGSKVLFRIAAALFKVYEKDLLAVKDAGDLFTALRKVGKDVVDADILIAAAYKSYQPINPAIARDRASSSGGNSGKFGGGSLKNQANLTALLLATAPPPSSSSTKNASSSSNNTSSSSSGTSTKLSSTSPAFSSLKKTLKEFNPRLLIQSDAGKVPSLLQGVGLAHVGPIPERPTVQRYESVTDINSYVWDLSDGTLTIELDQEMLKAAKHMSDTLLSVEVYQLSQQNTDALITAGAGGGGEEVKPETEGEEGLSNNGASPQDNQQQQQQQQLASSHQDPDLINSADSYDQSLFTEPHSLLGKIRDSQVGPGLLAGVDSHLKGKRNRTFKPGEFTFTRADIAVWRNTFRPGLQERYERMEKARKEYTQRKNSIINKESTSPRTPTSPISISTPAPNSSTTPREGGGGAAATVRKSIEGKLPTTPLVDIEAIKINYDVDHQFEKEDAKETS